jgi:prophage regulatory protein
MKGDKNMAATNNGNTDSVRIHNNYRQAIDRMVREKEVVKLTGLSRSTIWRLERRGQFPSRKKLSAGTVGRSLREIEEWMSSRETIVA